MPMTGIISLSSGVIGKRANIDLLTEACLIGLCFAEEAARIDQRIAGYLADLDVTDATEADDADAERTAAALVELKARRAELAALAARLEAEHRTTLVEGEPDARD